MPRAISRRADGAGTGSAILIAGTVRISRADGSTTFCSYCEEGELHDLPSDGMPDDLSRVQRVGAAQVIQSPLSIVNCPSRRPTRVFPLTANEGGTLGFFNSITPYAAGRSDYAINSGHVYCEWPNGELGQGPKSYTDAEIWTANRTLGKRATTLSSAHLPAMAR